MSKTLSALTTSDAADLYGVSPRTVAYARRAIMNGTSALTAALETGRISVRGAAWLADYAEPAVQDWVVASPHRAGVRQRLRLARYGRRWRSERRGHPVRRRNFPRRHHPGDPQDRGLGGEGGFACDPSTGQTAEGCLSGLFCTGAEYFSEHSWSDYSFSHQALQLAADGRFGSGGSLAPGSPSQPVGRAARALG